MKDDQKCINNCVNALGSVSVFYNSVVYFHAERSKGLTTGKYRNYFFLFPIQ